MIVWRSEILSIERHFGLLLVLWIDKLAGTESVENDGQRLATFIQRIHHLKIENVRRCHSCFHQIRHQTQSAGEK